MKFNRLIIVLAVLMAIPSLSFAELYKWKDKNGQIQYTDTPPPSNIKRQDLSGKKSISATGKEPLSTVTNSQAVPAQAPNKELQKQSEQQPTANPEEAAAKVRQENAEREKNNKQEKEAQAKLKAENCKAAKANFESYSQGGRVYKMNEKGEREYLDDAGLKSGAAKARSEMNEYCI